MADFFSIGPSPTPHGQPAIPPRVAAAQDFLRFAEQAQMPVASPFDGSARSDGRSLTPKEQKVYDAALDVLLMYFRGEQDYEVTIAPSPPPDRGDDGPAERVRVDI